MVKIDENQIPDDNFRDFFLENYDLDGDRWFTHEEIVNIEILDISDKGITDLTGLKLLMGKDTDLL